MYVIYTYKCVNVLSITPIQYPVVLLSAYVVLYPFSCVLKLG